MARPANFLDLLEESRRKREAIEAQEAEKRRIEIEQELLRQAKNPNLEMAKNFGYAVLDEFKLAMKSDAEFQTLKKQGKEAIAYIKKNKKSRGGEGLCLFNLGRCYSNGIVVEKNKERAIYYYSWAVACGYVPAMCNLGMMVFGEKPKLAAKHFKKAARHGYVFAYKNLALCYLHTYGLEPSFDNIKNAYDYFRLAYLENVSNVEGGIRTCLKYFNKYNIPVPGNDALPLSLEKEVRIANSVITGMAAEYEYSKTHSLKTMTKDEFIEKEQLADAPILPMQKREDYLKLARAKYDLAQCYFHGLHGLKKNIKLALKYAHEAADAKELNFAPAATLLGEFYRKKSGIKANEVNEIDVANIANEAKKAKLLAYQYYCQAAYKGFPKAQYQLALLYRDDAFMEAIDMHDTQKNSELAFTWAMRAAAEGYKEARDLIIVFYQQQYSGIPEDLSEKKILKILKKLKPEMDTSQVGTALASTKTASASAKASSSSVATVPIKTPETTAAATVPVAVVTTTATVTTAIPAAPTTAAAATATPVASTTQAAAVATALAVATTAATTAATPVSKARALPSTAAPSTKSQKGAIAKYRGSKLSPPPEPSSLTQTLSQTTGKEMDKMVDPKDHKAVEDKLKNPGVHFASDSNIIPIPGRTQSEITRTPQKLKRKMTETRGSERGTETRGGDSWEPLKKRSKLHKK